MLLHIPLCLLRQSVPHAKVSNFCSGDVCRDPGVSPLIPVTTCIALDWHALFLQPPPLFGQQCSCAGHVPAHNDMLCTLSCVSGVNDTANLTHAANAPNISAGLFSPPYAINNGNEQLPLNTRTIPVTASHFDGASFLC